MCNGCSSVDVFTKKKKTYFKAGWPECVMNQGSFFGSLLRIWTILYIFFLSSPLEFKMFAPLLSGSRWNRRAHCDIRFIMTAVASESQKFRRLPLLLLLLLPLLSPALHVHAMPCLSSLFTVSYIPISLSIYIVYTVYVAPVISFSVRCTA